LSGIVDIARRLARALLPMVARPSARQVAALCYRDGRKGREILLITSRGTGRWIIPKGWPMDGHSDAQAAAREAWEEAGVQKGDVAPTPIGRYPTRKVLDNGALLACTVAVYAMRVDGLAARFPERHQRRRKWMTLGQAAKAVDEKALADLIAAFAANR
jgi:8-oxo-dGTP pyrophosphatase MutT (NUDIX family)